MPNDAAAEKASSAEHGDGVTARCHHDSNSPVHVGVSLTLVVEGPIRALEQPDESVRHDDVVLSCASSSTAEARTHCPPVVTERLEPSLSYQPVAIFRLVEIFGLVEADRLAELRRSEIGAVEIGADEGDAGQVGTAELGALEGRVGEVGAP
jgi:hypothetical protein